MKQTAVKWLYNNLKSHFEHDGDLLEVVQISFEQAKEMEKEQILDAWQHGFDWGMMEQSLAEQGKESTLIDAKHYYNEKYEKD
jgi:hypothetical protein